MLSFYIRLFITLKAPVMIGHHQTCQHYTDARPTTPMTKFRPLIPGDGMSLPDAGH